MKNIIITSFLLMFVVFSSCDLGYDVDDVAPKSDARLVYVSIDDNYVDWENQRSFFNHQDRTINVKMLKDKLKSGRSFSALKVYTAPVLWATISPEAGQEEDWSSMQRTYTVTSGDGSVSNVYTIIIEEVDKF